MHRISRRSPKKKDKSGRALIDFLCVLIRIFYDIAASELLLTFIFIQQQQQHQQIFATPWHSKSLPAMSTSGMKRENIYLQLHGMLCALLSYIHTHTQKSTKTMPVAWWHSISHERERECGSEVSGGKLF